jgi:hypothetical protein
MTEEIKPREPITVPIADRRTGEVANYEIVASRLSRFRDDYPTARVEAIIILDDEERVVMRCEISLPFGEPPVWSLLSAAHAQENRLGEINETSALENCETSALGRALALIGYGSPHSIASAEEVLAEKEKRKALQEEEPGANVLLGRHARQGDRLIVLQAAASQGMDALRECYEDLDKAAQMSVKRYLPNLKKEAKKAGERPSD